MNLDFAEWNRETIRNRIKSLRAAAAKAKAKATTMDNNKVKKKKNKRPRGEIVVQREEGRSSKLNNNMLIKTELHGMTPSGKEFLGNDAYLYDNGDFLGINDISYMCLGQSALNEGK